MALMALIIAIDVVAWLDITSFTLGCFDASRRVQSRCQAPQKCDQRRRGVTNGWLTGMRAAASEDSLSRRKSRESNSSNEKRFNSMEATLGSR